MKTIRALLIAASSISMLGACVGVETTDGKANQRLCDSLPTSSERQTCRNSARDSTRPDAYDTERGMDTRGRYTLPEEICREQDSDDCPVR